MPTYTLCLLEDRLAKDAARQLPSALRLLYVVEGSALIERAQFAANSACYSSDSCHLQAGPQGAQLYRWELLPAEAPASESPPLLQREISLDASTDYLMRCDRVDFPPGGIAYTHTHPGPGIRCLLEGTLTIDTEGRTSPMHPGDPWFERGPDPVLATASPTQATSFVRGMLLPRSLEGKSSIQYVHTEDASKPKPQRYTRFVDQFIDLP